MAPRAATVRFHALRHRRRASSAAARSIPASMPAANAASPERRPAAHVRSQDPGDHCIVVLTQDRLELRRRLGEPPCGLADDRRNCFGGVPHPLGPDPDRVQLRVPRMLARRLHCSAQVTPRAVEQVGNEVPHGHICLRANDRELGRLDAGGRGARRTARRRSKRPARCGLLCAVAASASSTWATPGASVAGIISTLPRRRASSTSASRASPRTVPSQRSSSRSGTAQSWIEHRAERPKVRTQPAGGHARLMDALGVGVQSDHDVVAKEVDDRRGERSAEDLAHGRRRRRAAPTSTSGGKRGERAHGAFVLRGRVGRAGAGRTKTLEHLVEQPVGRVVGDLHLELAEPSRDPAPRQHRHLVVDHLGQQPVVQIEQLDQPPDRSQPDHGPERRPSGRTRGSDRRASSGGVVASSPGNVNSPRTRRAPPSLSGGSLVVQP